MRVPVSWLRDFAPFGQARELVAVLDDLGLVVEGVEEVGRGLVRVVVARVTEIAAIAGADRIRRVTVDAGGREVQVVCGAWNFAEGDLVPLAPVGTVLPEGMEIGRRKMKGVTSEGMLCSGRELGRLRRRGRASRSRDVETAVSSQVLRSPKLWASSGTPCSTSQSRRTVPTQCALRGSPATSRRGSSSSSSCQSRLDPRQCSSETPGIPADLFGDG